MDPIFLILIVLMLGLLFFSSRQRKKHQQQQESLQNSIAVGDVVVMTSGISGTVVDTDDERTIDLEIAPDVITTWLRAAVREKLVADEAVVDPEEIEDADVVPQSSVPTESTPVVDAGSAPERISELENIEDEKTDKKDDISSPRSS